MVDNPTPNKRRLEAVRAVLEGRVTADVEEYSIAGRSLTRIPFDQLRREEQRLIRLVNMEYRRKRGQFGPVRSKVTFGGP